MGGGGTFAGGVRVSVAGAIGGSFPAGGGPVSADRGMGGFFWVSRSPLCWRSGEKTEAVRA